MSWRPGARSARCSCCRGWSWRRRRPWCASSARPTASWPSSSAAAACSRPPRCSRR
ncbi:hypothetical protein D7319_29120 [Streptomyces radicis]|uniref:Uncharacterized protein n=1 Tax=Streptomyces radicis TaxID=1750517 RepID=A0A3A9VVR4_9ACTN|nr:hypothetical protein D7319_29120 [Streptomyces radicis]RKN14771.1 hypothetical protein D7318_28880 [Streptomyces radicis]